jgi:hypothetical protein
VIRHPEFLLREFVLKRLRHLPIVKSFSDAFERRSTARRAAPIEHAPALEAGDAAPIEPVTLPAPSDPERPDETALSYPLPELQRKSSDLGSFLAAFSELWHIDQYNDTFVGMEIALDQALAFHPHSSDLRIFKAAIPSRRYEWQETAGRCLALAREDPAMSHWLYAIGLPAAVSAADYETAHALADLAEPYYKSWPLASLFTMLDSICQSGEHAIAYPLWNYLLSEYPNEITPHVASRMAWFFRNTREAPYLEDVRLISLGENCLPWARLAAWGLRKRTWAPSEQMPFNFGVQRAAGCLPLLRSRFAGLTDPDKLTILKNADGDELPYHRDYKFVFNHEVGSYWTDQNYKNLRARYDHRISNFLNLGCAGPRVYAYFLWRTASISGVEEAIADLAEDEDYRLVILDARSDPETWSPTDPRTTYARIESPFPGFNWSDGASMQSEAGVAFERRIHDVVRAAMRTIAGERTDESVP